MACDYRPRVICDLMQSRFGKNVIILGRVSSVDPTGKKLVLQDCAGSNVIVFLKHPINGILELQTWCEAEGKVRGKGAMDAERFDQLPQALFENFDQELYVQMVRILANPGTLNNYNVEDKSEHHGDGTEVELITNPGESKESELGGLAEDSFLNL